MEGAIEGGAGKVNVGAVEPCPGGCETGGWKIIWPLRIRYVADPDRPVPHNGFRRILNY
jgi:hypothetical protein